MSGDNPTGGASEPAKLLCFQVGQRVRDLRRAEGLTRRQLASAANISERYLGQLENGQANASIQILHRIAAEFGRTVSAVLPAAPNGDVGGDALERLIAGLSDGQRAEAHALLASRFGMPVDTGRSRPLKGVALIGLRGAGKTTLGRDFADLTGVPFKRLSQAAADRAGLEMTEIMELMGPDVFRRLEHEALQALVDTDERIVLETSGGIVSHPESFDLLLERFHTVWLKASPDEHMQRVIDQRDLRPIAGRKEAMKDLVGLLNARNDAYARADTVIDTSGRTPRDCLRDLVEACKVHVCVPA